MLLPPQYEREKTGETRQFFFASPLKKYASRMLLVDLVVFGCDALAKPGQHFGRVSLKKEVALQPQEPSASPPPSPPILSALRANS